MGAADKLLSLFLYGNACVVAAVGKAHFNNYFLRDGVTWFDLRLVDGLRHRQFA